jgi:hypothetical protein
LAFSFTPWFQPGDLQTTYNPSSRFNGFRKNYEGKPLKRFFISKPAATTGLKRGVNEKLLESIRSRGWY